MGERELDLVQDYTGHFADMVLGVYYAKARMYDAGDRRFMAVDPVRGNVTNPKTMIPYVYVVNNPIRFIDPTGEYYIVQNGTVKVLSYKVAGYNDPSGLDYGDIYDVVTEFVPDGTYSIIPETRVKVVAKDFIDFIPWVGISTLIYESVNNITNVVGGNSAEGMGLSNLIDFSELALKSNEFRDLLNELVKNSSKVADKLVNSVGKLFTALDILGREVYLTHDNIIFTMIERNNLSTHADNKETLEARMKLAYKLIQDNADYFTTKTIFGGKTLFEIDLALCSSKNSSKDIQKLIEQFKFQMEAAFISSDYYAKDNLKTQYNSEVKKLAAELYQFLSDYSGRLAGFDDLFTEIMSLMID